MNGSRYCLSSYLQSGHWRDDVLQMIDHCSLIGKDWHYHRIINSNSCIRLTNYFQEFHLQEEVEPFVIGDGTVTVLVHRLENNLPLQCSPNHRHHHDQGNHEQDLEAGVPLLLGLERRRQSEPLLVCRWDRDHCCKLVAGHLVVVFFSLHNIDDDDADGDDQGPAHRDQHQRPGSTSSWTSRSSCSSQTRCCQPRNKSKFISWG